MFFFMMCGPAGSGKTTEAQSFVDTDPEHRVWISSDEIRKETYGDESIQGDSNYVFSTMMERTLEALAKNKIVVYDATNIKAKYRINALNKIKESFPDIQAVCVVMTTPKEEAIERAIKRNRSMVGVPEELIEQKRKAIIESQYRNFEYPTLSEGWADIIKLPNKN